MVTFEEMERKKVAHRVARIEKKMSVLRKDLSDYEERRDLDSTYVALQEHTILARQRYNLLTKAGLS